MPIDIQFDTDICCGNCREGRREHGFIKYLIDQTQFLREEIKAKNKIITICLRHNYNLHGPCFIENSNNLNENIINIIDELNNSSTLKDDFKESSDD